jgi:hypothetical protein
VAEQEGALSAIPELQTFRRSEFQHRHWPTTSLIRAADADDEILRF